jgi:hypothetical protein
VEDVRLFQWQSNFLRDQQTFGISRDEVEGFRVPASLMLDNMCKDLQ